MPHSASTIASLQGLLQVTRAVRGEHDVPTVLAAIARAVAESLGFRTVVVNVYRPELDDFTVATVHGSDLAREALVGTAAGWDTWGPMTDERFARRGAYFLPEGSFDWGGDEHSFVPELEVLDDPDAWHPEDALFVPLRHSHGHLLGILSVDEPLSGRRPSDAQLDVLVAFAEHAALALEGAQEAEAAARHRRGLEQLLAISSRLTETRSTGALLASICQGVQEALEFERVCIDLPDPATGRLAPRASAGWSEELVRHVSLSDVELERLCDPAFASEGCYLLTDGQARARLPEGRPAYTSERNGQGRFAWQNHWLVVPLRDGAGGVAGAIWVDDPTDRLLPTRGKLQALRVFANQAVAALDSARRFEELQFLADHDPLTRLANRRVFGEQLESELARATRYGRSLALVLCDVNGFKQVNDVHGHQAGDAVLARLATILAREVRCTDRAYRTGGDEFALILPETGRDAARMVVERIASAVASDQELRGAGVSASFGVAVGPDDGQDVERLFAAADEAMYAAKRSRGGVRFAA